MGRTSGKYLLLAACVPCVSFVLLIANAGIRHRTVGTSPSGGDVDNSSGSARDMWINHATDEDAADEEETRPLAFVHRYTVSMPLVMTAPPSHGTRSSADCNENCTRMEQLQSGVSSFIPLFLKFHKVGSGTVAEVLRRHCGAVSRRAGLPNGEHYPWRPRPGVYCGKTPHEHASMAMYHDGGVQQFVECTHPPPHLPPPRPRRKKKGSLVSAPTPAPSPSSKIAPPANLAPFTAPVRLYVVLRDPLQRFLSGVYFWKSGWARMDSRLLEIVRGANSRNAPAAAEEKGHNISKFSGLTSADLTPLDMERLAVAVYRYGVPDLDDAGPLLPYSYVLGRLPRHPARRDEPSEKDVIRACERLERDFTVGVTEQMNSFMVLIALENQWPLNEMCADSLHVNKVRPKTEDAYHPDAMAHLRALLAPDFAIHAFAAKTHALQTSSYGNFSASLAIFRSAAFTKECDVTNERHSAFLSSLPWKDRKARRNRYSRSGDCVFA